MQYEQVQTQSHHDHVAVPSGIGHWKHSRKTLGCAVPRLMPLQKAYFRWAEMTSIAVTPDPQTFPVQLRLNSYTVSPPYPWVPHPRIQLTMGQKYLSGGNQA
jgi:hypothetical protein